MIPGHMDPSSCQVSASKHLKKKRKKKYGIRLYQSTHKKYSQKREMHCHLSQPQNELITSARVVYFANLKLLVENKEKWIGETPYFATFCYNNHTEA